MVTGNVHEPQLAPSAPGHRGVLWWRLDQGPRALSSAPVGGGLSRPAWLVNVGVPLDYARTDLATHAHEIATALALQGQGIALFTAADVTAVQHVEREGVLASATVGVTKPTWAADAGGGFTPWSSNGTINIVVQLPVRLAPGALVNAVMTATEAKTQALVEAGVPGTGTASDAVVILSAPHGPAEPFAGPRSRWGSRLALAVHAAVAAGLRVHR